MTSEIKPAKGLELEPELKSSVTFDIHMTDEIQSQSSSLPSQPGLKSLLSAAKELLRPPEPLPASPVKLLSRLSSASALLPASWKNEQSGWLDSDEIEDIGDDSSLKDPEDSARRKRRRDQLVYIVGKRCMILVVALQGFLVKEFLPPTDRGGFETKDCKPDV